MSSTTATKTSTGPRTTAKTQRTPLSPTLRSYSLPDALTALTDLDVQYGVIPDHARDQVGQTVADILSAAHDIGISDIAQLVEQHCALLTRLTGLGKPTAFHATKDAEGLHRYRNIALALTAAAALAIGADTDTIFTRWTNLKARTTQTQRPFTDDEIVLARVHTVIVTTAKPTSQAGNIYAMTDAGAAPGETPNVTLDDFDDAHCPGDLRVPGNHQLSARNLPLDRFGATVLAGLTRTAAYRGTASTKPLTYSPRKAVTTPGAKTASAQGVLDRTLVQLGLSQDDVTASSITLWRAHVTWVRDGEEAAVHLSGRKSKHHLYRQLFRVAQPRTTPNTDDIETSFL